MVLGIIEQNQGGTKGKNSQRARNQSATKSAASQQIIKGRNQQANLNLTQQNFAVTNMGQN